MVLVDRCDEVMRCLRLLGVDKKVNLLPVQSDGDVLAALATSELAIAHPGSLVKALTSSTKKFHELVPQLRWMQVRECCVCTCG